jgi:hypothetical protein
MKTKLLIAMMLAAVLEAGVPVRAAVSYVNLTTLHTNIQIISGYATVSGVYTNLPFTLINSNYYTLGDSSPTSFGKINADIYYIYNWMLTNSFGGVANLILTNTGASYISMDGTSIILNTNGMGGGIGSGGVTNAVPTNGVSIVIGSTLFLNTNYTSGSFLLKSFGAGNDLTITNSFTLVNTNVTGYTLHSVTMTGITIDTNANGTYVYDSDIGSLTNQGGYLLGTIDPTGWGTIDGDTNRPINIVDFDPSTNYVVTIVVSPDNNLGVGTWHYISHNNYTNGDYGQHAYANYVPATTNWVFHSITDSGTRTFYTTNTPAVPANGSVYQTYTNGVAFTNTGFPLAVLATFNTTNRVPGIFFPNFTNSFSSIPTNLDWAIFQPNGTPTTNGTYTNYTLVTYSTTNRCTTLHGNVVCTHPFSQLDGLSNSNNFINGCPSGGHHDATQGFSSTVPDPSATCIATEINGVQVSPCGCINVPPAFIGTYPIP